MLTRYFQRWKECVAYAFPPALLAWLVQGSQHSPPPHKCVCKYQACHIAKLHDKHTQPPRATAESRAVLSDWSLNRVHPSIFQPNFVEQAKPGPITSWRRIINNLPLYYRNEKMSCWTFTVICLFAQTFAYSPFVPRSVTSHLQFLFCNIIWVGVLACMPASGLTCVWRICARLRSQVQIWK